MISVLIPTAGRAGLLTKCLDGLACGRRAPDETLVLLTDPDPATEAALKRHPLHGLRWIRWDWRGSYAEARNRLTREARGAKIAFIDDDCVPASDWLERAEAWLDRIDAVGGLVVPANSLRFPPWWDPAMGWLAGFSVPGHLGRFAGSVYCPQTANLALRRTVLEAEPFQELGGRFVQGAEAYALGREDVELWRRLRRKGYAVAFDPALMVLHHIPQERLEWKTLLERACRDGQAYVRRGMNRAALWAAWGDAAYVPLVLARDWLWHPWPDDPQRALDRLWIARQRAFLKAYREAANEEELLAWRAARRAGLRHVVVSELKRPVGKIKAAFSRRFAPRQTYDRPPKRALVVSAGFLGDIVLMMPPLAAWRKGNPSAAVDVATTSASGAALLESQGLADSVFRIHPDARDGAVRLDRLIDGGNYGLILAPYFHPVFYWKVGHLFRWRGPAVLSFSDENGLQRWSDRARPMIRLLRHSKKHEILALADLFSLAGPLAPLEPWSLRFEADEERRAQLELQRINPGGAPLVALHPDAGKAEKTWVWERWFELALTLQTHGAQSLFIVNDRLLGPAGDSIKRFNLHAHAVAPAIRPMALLLRGCDAMVAPDTGPKHLACAVRTPTVAIFGPLDERRWGALWDKERHVVVRRAAWDLTPEERSGLPENHQCAMAQVNDVLAATLSLLRLGRANKLR